MQAQTPAQVEHLRGQWKRMEDDGCLSDVNLTGRRSPAHF
jgi:hypothetical protein